MNLLDHPDAQALLDDADVSADDVRSCEGRLTAFAQRTVSSGIAGVVHSLGSVWLAALGSLGAFGAGVPKTPSFRSERRLIR